MAYVLPTGYDSKTKLGSGSGTSTGDGMETIWITTPKPKLYQQRHEDSFETLIRWSKRPALLQVQTLTFSSFQP